CADLNDSSSRRYARVAFFAAIDSGPDRLIARVSLSCATERRSASSDICPVVRPYTSPTVPRSAVTLPTLTLNWTSYSAVVLVPKATRASSHAVKRLSGLPEAHQKTSGSP